VISEERMLHGKLRRIRCVRRGPDGYVYILTDAPDGILARLEPVPLDRRSKHRLRKDLTC